MSTTPPMVAQSGGRDDVPAATDSTDGSIPTNPTSHDRKGTWLAAVFLAPALLLLLVMVLYPIVFSLVRSLYDAPGSSFLGFGNYVSLFTDGNTLTALKNNVIWMVVAPTLVTALGLMFAVLTERISWVTVFKTLVFMPMAVSFLASGVIFRLVYDEEPDRGLANAMLVAVHDTFAPSSSYPGGRPGDPDAFPAADDGTITSAESVSTGSTVPIPLLAVSPDDVPAAATVAEEATEPGSDSAISGTVWLDFTLGGGGEPDVVDETEKGLPGMEVEAVQDGKVVGSTTTSANGTFTVSGLAPGDYELRLPAANFAAPYNGVTWLGPNLITPAIIAAYIWIYAGFAMVLIAAGMAAIPRDALEAARMDGATEWQVFRRVTMPLLAPVLVVVFVTLVINVLKVFDLVFIIAPGSVQPDANVLALQMWKVSFGGGQDQGLGSAIGVFLLLLVIPAMVFNIRRFKKEQ
ncbi:MAG: ABC transporter permease subunit [Nocardioidaceae bacterium]